MDGQTLRLPDQPREPGRPGIVYARPYTRIAVLGMGSWGTALASVAAASGREVRLWGRREDLAQRMRETGRNDDYLPDTPLPDGIEPTSDLAHALDGAEAVLIVTPSSSLREMCGVMRPLLPQGVPLALCCKGIERRTGYLLSHAVQEELPGHPVGALSGPTFARETALGHPTAATIAFEFRYTDRLAPDDSPAARLSVSMSCPSFRPYMSDDLVGVEVGGAVKNVIAIACGMMTGAGYAENTRAALITRGIDEMKVLAEALGGKRETVTGLSGAGDLTLTCSSTTSRNMSLGVQLGEGKSRAECFDGRDVVVEGEISAASVIELARRIGVSMPICEAVHAILYDGADLNQTFTDLWARPIESEPRALEIELAHPSAMTES
ncbi:glycerol-3-phosphate dehydrogenase (NAD(P)+) [Roseivivax marinus]|uniref:NAD(P)H-dependent glycerol-3-phosphate dehydrogenase n=1 Tax=Roseivivax marinus TaxID=1379903 RepID=UPI0008D32EED|nr:NAD(P)H-dependent glycerol-3-phosphate dehydrogenase [Roseivivax marinus]SEK78740.1 glycerol-3-phosphate dehydrogenase (NAD(P)+) [Roseivivax marinus]